MVLPKTEENGEGGRGRSKNQKISICCFSKFSPLQKRNKITVSSLRVQSGQWRTARQPTESTTLYSTEKLTWGQYSEIRLAEQSTPAQKIRYLSIKKLVLPLKG